jgi:hypothetical protein
MKSYLYRSGNGNEGNYRRHVVTLTDTDCPFAAVAALLVNEYQAGTDTRAHIMAEVQTDGEPEFGTAAMVYEGPHGETEFGAAWRTAELEPMEPSELDPLENLLADVLDIEALAYYIARTTTPLA